MRSDRSKTVSWMAVVGALAIAACGPDVIEAVFGGPGDRSPLSATQECRRTARATPEELGASPRPDRDAEFLAIEASGAFVAPEDLYQRIARDLALVRTAIPQVQEVQHMPPFLPGVLLGLTEAAAEKARAGTYGAWDCLNAYYGGEVEWVGSGLPLASVKHKPRIDTRQLAEDYARLPGVSYATSNGPAGDGTDICVSIEADAYVYIFDDAGGDCPSGCTEHRYYGASVRTDGSVTVLGVWDPALDVPSPPDWFTSRPDCAASL
jgi:hypothetical protein